MSDLSFVAGEFPKLAATWRETCHRASRSASGVHRVRVVVGVKPAIGLPEVPPVNLPQLGNPTSTVDPIKPLDLGFNRLSAELGGQPSQ